MVVHFSREVPPITSSSDDRHPVKKKYLVARNHEHKNSIFDYVHLSSSLLRKVRYGQSLDAALQTRSPWTGDASSPGGFRNGRGVSLSPVTMWRRNDILPSPARRESSLNQRAEKPQTHDSTIRFGRQIQLQAIDGGYLAIDADGYLIKVPKSHRVDSTTLLALFPHDPLRASGSKSHVCCDESCFIVLGAATIQSEHNVLYADSKRTYDPPASLRNAVIRHQRQHRGACTSPHNELTTVRVESESKMWSFQATTARGDILQHGMMVQLKQCGATVHYETEQIIRKKYKPIVTNGPESDDAPSLAESSPHDTSSPSIGDNGVKSRGSPSTNNRHVWVQQNDISSQSDTRESQAVVLKPWDNLWFIIDVTTEREQERKCKKKQAVLLAEREAELRYSNDSDNRHENDENRMSTRSPKRRERPTADTESNHFTTIVEEQLSDNNLSEEEDDDNSTTKRMSVLNARIFVSKAAEEAQRHAAAIIVRFMRRIFHRESERRAKDMIDRRIRRTGKHHRYGDLDVSTLSTMQQLRILQCYKPTVYGSQHPRGSTGTELRHIPGISLQGTKYPRLETNRLASMQRDLIHLGSEEFYPQRVLVQRSGQQRPRPRLGDQAIASNLRAKHQHLSRERDRDRQFHVQLAMVHREKPPFRFGKLDQRLQVRHRPQTAPASPIPKP